MSLMMFGQVLSLFGSMQQASAQRQQAARVAEQQEFNARLERIRGQQEHNDRLDAFETYRSTANSIRGKTNRDVNDRSFKARVNAGKDKSTEQIDRARVNSMFAENRMRYQAENTRRQGAINANATMMAGMANFAIGMDKMGDIT
jgi:hypothetical protein